MEENNNLKDEEKENEFNNDIFNLKIANNDNIIYTDLSNNDILNISNDKGISSLAVKTKLNYSYIIKRIIDNIKNNEKDNIYENQYKINLLLMSSLNDISIKYICLNYLIKFNEDNNNYSMIKYIFSKIYKYYENNNKLNKNIFINILNSFSQILFRNKNYFYAYYYLKKVKKLLGTKNNNTEIDLFFTDISECISKYVKSKYDLFKDKNKMNKDKLKMINDALKEILNNNSSDKKDIKENKNGGKFENDNDNDNDEYCSYLYMINTNWVMRAIVFIDYYKIYLTEIMMQDDNFLKNAFNEENILFTYFKELNDKNDKNDKFSTNIMFPGPIDNYNLLKNRDFWEDSINDDENCFIKDNLILNKDYYLISQRNWSILKDIFDSTNEIKKNENENIELIGIKALILEKRFRKKRNKDLLRRRYIQTRKNTKIKKLKEKLIRCINYELKKNGHKDKYYEEEELEEMKKIINDTNISFYLIDKENKNILIEICIAFTNNILIYNSTQLKKIEINDEDSINSLFKIYNKKNNILIIELNEKNCDNFLQEIKPILNNNKNINFIYRCNICENEININKKYNCGKCNISFFCSETCSNVSGEHKTLHKFLVPLLKPDFNLEILKNNKNTYLDKHYERGLAGLINYGNTCYINSVIQCLSNTIDFRNYFISDFYKNEQNFLNFNIQNDFLEEFSQLLKNIWLGNDEIVYPKNFIISFCKINQQFKANCQQDAQEFLSILFSNLHEKLNRVNMKSEQKNIEEKKDKENEIEASKRWEKYEKLKNDSIIYDLFNGQFISNITCHECGKNTTTFEQFNILSLPIPKTHTLLTIKYFTDDSYKSFPFSVNEKTTFGDLKDKALLYVKNDIIEKILKNTGRDLNNILDDRDKNDIIYNYNNTKIPKSVLYKYIDVIILNKNKMIINQTIKDNEKIISLFNKADYEIVLYEKNNISRNFVNIYISATYFNLKINKLLFYKKKIINYSYPKLLSFDKNITLASLEQILKNKFNSILNLNNINIKEYSGNPIQIIILHFKKESPCVFCQKTLEESSFCSLENLFKKYNIISDIIEEFEDSHIILAANSEYFSVNKKCLLNNILFINPDIEEKKEDINIYDCLEKFREEEILEKQNKYFCEKCKAQIIAKKKIQIFRPPPYLIIQLKRFKYINNKFTKYFYDDETQKIETLVIIPEILDLKDYVIGPDKDNSKYELYGNILHIENHYVAICKNEERWILFNDDNVKQFSFRQTRHSYLLFYKKKNL